MKTCDRFLRLAVAARAADVAAANRMRRILAARGIESFLDSGVERTLCEYGLSQGGVDVCVSESDVSEALTALRGVLGGS